MWRLSARAVIGLIVISSSAAATFAALRVHRTVQASEIVGATRVGASGQGCGDLARRPPSGGSVVLTVSEQGARRDEPQVSFLLPASREALYVIDHGRGTYSRLRLPLEGDSVFSPLYKVMGEEAAALHEYSPEAGIETREEDDAIIRTATVSNSLGRRFDVEVAYALEEQDPGGHGAFLERSVLALRHDGAEWLSALPATGGLILSLAEARYEPETKARYAENLSKMEDAGVPDGLLDLPEGYREVTFPAGCLGVH